MEKSSIDRYDTMIRYDMIRRAGDVACVFAIKRWANIMPQVNLSA